MRCIVCNHKDTKVVETREGQGGTGIRRRRECLKCKYRFSTLEEVEILDLTVVKRNGDREAYSRQKLESGLRKSLQKRPVTAERFKELVGGIERDIQKTKKGELTSEQIGEIVMGRLKGFDNVAYIRFASVYRAFEDVHGFRQVIDTLAKKPRVKRRKR